MKKIISVLMAVIMAMSVFAVTMVPAMAADDVLSPTATTAANKKPTLMVNGQVTTTDIIYSPDATNSAKITFTYKGEGTLTGWETNLEDLGLVEGVDYEITYNDDGSLTIEFISEDALDAWNNGEVTVNAVVEFDEDETTTKASEKTTATTTKKNESSKSPDTGASSSVVAGAVAVAGAGIAVLAAVKKREAE
ncbi:MAG: hypothetical protein ACI4IQ_05540 [Eubacterium sp.]